MLMHLWNLPQEALGVSWPYKSLQRSTQPQLKKKIKVLLSTCLLIIDITAKNLWLQSILETKSLESCEYTYSVASV